MRLLLDTHCWLWWIGASSRLNAETRALIANRNSNVYLSPVSSWEIGIKYSLGKLPLPQSPEQYIPARLARDRILSLPVEHRHALHVAGLPFHHRDPFDRLLIAQAQVEDIPIVTVDQQFEPYDVKIIWAG